MTPGSWASTIARGNVAVLGLPVCLDDNKIIGTQSPFWVVETCQGVFFIIFRTHGKKDTNVLKPLYVILELIVGLAYSSLLADFDAVHAVIPNYAAP